MRLLLGKKLAGKNPSGKGISGELNKLKKTCDAIEGDIAGFGEDWIVVTPSFAKVYRTTATEDITGAE